MSRPTQQQFPQYSWRAHSPQTRLVYLRDEDEVNRELSEPTLGPWGFDLEWKPTFVRGERENPVALVQLANSTTIYLIQVTAMRNFPDRLRELLQNPYSIKAGVSIQNDCQKLWKDYGVSVSNCVDLGLLARTVDNPGWKGKYTNAIGLARLCETYFQQTLAKGKTQRSNWEAQLSAIQQEYAANDCHSGLSLYLHLSAMIPTLNPAPLPAFYSFDLNRGQLFQPGTSHLPSKQLTAWRAYNPFYDPGPPPPDRPPRAESSASTPYSFGGSSDGSYSSRPRHRGGYSGRGGRGSHRWQGSGAGSRPHQSSSAMPN